MRAWGFGMPAARLAASDHVLKVLGNNATMVGTLGSVGGLVHVEMSAATVDDWVCGNGACAGRLLVGSGPVRVIAGGVRGTDWTGASFGAGAMLRGLPFE